MRIVPFLILWSTIALPRGGAGAPPTSGRIDRDDRQAAQVVRRLDDRALPDRPCGPAAGVSVGDEEDDGDDNPFAVGSRPAASFDAFGPEGPARRPPQGPLSPRPTLRLFPLRC